MKLEASLAQEVDGFDLSGLGCLAHALGVATGGMMPDGPLDLGSEDGLIMLLQMLYLDAGDKRIVCGTSDSASGGVFALMSDGSIEIVTTTVGGGKLTAASRVATDDDYKDCYAYMSAGQLINSIAQEELMRAGHLQDEDEISGNLHVDISDAIRNKLTGMVKTIVKRQGMIIGGYKATLNGIPGGSTIEEAKAATKIEVMTGPEIEAERKHFLEVMGPENIFPQKVGQA